jgi:hypothetical protein
LRDFRRGETGGGHLIEQRLKEMVVLSVKEGDASGTVPERLAKSQASETPS